MFSCKPIWRIYFDDQQQDRGAFLLLFSLFLFVAITMMAMVIDQSKESLALETIQRAADASALAAVRQLNSTKQGWNNARRAAVLALKSNPVHGARSGFENLRLADNGPSGAWSDPTSAHATTTGTAGGVTFTVERGTIWFDNSLKNGLGDYVFKSLESDVDGFVSRGRWKGLVDTYLIANAVKTTVRLDRLPAYLGAVIGFDSFNDLERSAIAVSNTELEFEVAPLAIPYCQLLLDTNVHTNRGNHLIEEYKPKEQQKRELVFTEADPKRNLLTWSGMQETILDDRISRREGLTRFESFIRRPYATYNGESSICSLDPIAGEAPSCKHVPLYATIGKPTTTSGNVTQPGEVRDLFVQAMHPDKNKRIKAKLGGYFAPLHELSNNKGDVASASSVLDQFITSGELSFAQTFYQSGSGPIKTQSNFPYMRTNRPKDLRLDPEGRPLVTDYQGKHDTLFDLRLGWPTEFNIQGTEKKTWIKMILDYQSANKKNPHTRLPATWTNPLCHTDSNRIVSNDPQQKVRRVRAMVIAPGNPQYDYCDFGALFSGQQQHATPTIEDSLPTIVGTVEVDLFDHHLTEFSKNTQFLTEMNKAKLSRPVGYTGPYRRVITPHYPGIISQAVDRHPGELDVAQDQFFENIVNRVNDYKPLYEQCFGEPQKDEQGNVVADFNSPCAGKADEVAKGLSQIVDSTDIFPDAYFECFDVEFLLRQLLEADGTLWACLSYGACTEQNKQKTGSFNKLFNTINQILKGEQNIPARAFSHCLNQFKVGKSHPLDPESYDELRPLRADRGCGGVRGRLVYDPSQTKVWPTGSSHTAASPALIKVEDGEG